MGNMITAVKGPMFSGKTTFCMEKILKAKAANSELKVLVIRPQIDMRSQPEIIVTHGENGSSGKEFNLAKLGIDLFLVSDETQLADIPWPEYDLIFIDEGQFLPKIYKWVHQMAEAGKFVYVACLDLDYRGKSFPNIKALVFSTVVKVVTAKADCVVCESRGKGLGIGKATMSRRLDESGQPVPIDEEVEVVQIGNHYDSVCPDCYHETVPGSVVT